MTPPPIAPIGGAGDYSGLEGLGDHENERRRQRQSRPGKALVPTDIEPEAEPVVSAKPAAPASPPPAAFAAQLLGQPGKKRGLKGGPQVLDAARSTYLSREYSGPHDRRPPPGVTKKTEI